MAVVETVPTDGLVKRLTESWPPRSPAETRKNVPMPGSPARKPPIAIKSAAVKDMTVRNLLLFSSVNVSVENSKQHFAEPPPTAM